MAPPTPLLRGFGHKSRASGVCAGRRSVYTVQFSQEESRAELGKQLPAMLKTSGNWLRSRGENHAAFLRPISLDRPGGNCGCWNERTAGSVSSLPSLQQQCLPFLSTHCLQTSSGCSVLMSTTSYVQGGKWWIFFFLHLGTALNHMSTWVSFTTGLFTVSLSHVSC